MEGGVGDVLEGGSCERYHMIMWFSQHDLLPFTRKFGSTLASSVIPVIAVISIPS